MSRWCTTTPIPSRSFQDIAYPVPQRLGFVRRPRQETCEMHPDMFRVQPQRYDMHSDVFARRKMLNHDHAYLAGVSAGSGTSGSEASAGTCTNQQFYVPSIPKPRMQRPSRQYLGSKANRHYAGLIPADLTAKLTANVELPSDEKEQNDEEETLTGCKIVMLRNIPFWIFPTDVSELAINMGLGQELSSCFIPGRKSTLVTQKLQKKGSNYAFVGFETEQACEYFATLVDGYSFPPLNPLNPENCISKPIEVSPAHNHDDDIAVLLEKGAVVSL